MVNTKLLEQAIEASGYKKGYIAKRVGLSRAGLRNCMDNRSEFRISQISALCVLLKLNSDQRNAIFFAQEGA